jgi:hypothetical protein
MQDSGPYTVEELRAMRRLLIASGYDVETWCRRLRRSADFLLSLSPQQAGIVAQQAAAIAADPGDFGDEEALAATRERLAAVAEGERATFVWREIVALRRSYYPDLPEE